MITTKLVTLSLIFWLLLINAEHFNILAVIHSENPMSLVLSENVLGETHDTAEEKVAFQTRII